MEKELEHGKSLGGGDLVLYCLRNYRKHFRCIMWKKLCGRKFDIIIAHIVS